jgi:predicted nucleotidyltransferase
VSEEQVAEVRRPQEGLAKLLNKGDSMARASLEVLERVLSASKLKISDFGVFGSLLHGFYRAEVSDLDFVVYGIRELADLRSVLSELYESGSLMNEFDTVNESRFARWRFEKYTAKEYVWHQRRKAIYGLLDSKSLKRTVKFEFEPVLKWDEIVNEYERVVDIETLGFVEALVRVVDDCYAPFMPSKYEIELLEVKSRLPIKVEPTRIVSYVEEFRMQLSKDEVGFVSGWLEEVHTKDSNFQQIVLTRRERYYEQALKLAKLT